MRILKWIKSNLKETQKDYSTEIEFAINQYIKSYNINNIDDDFEPTELVWDEVYKKFKNEELANNLVVLIPIAATRIYLKYSVVKLTDHIYKSGKKVILESIPVYSQIYQMLELRFENFTEDEIEHLLFCGSEYKLVHHAIKNGWDLKNMKISAPATG